MPHPKANPIALSITSGGILQRWIKRAFAQGYLRGYRAAQKYQGVRQADSTLLKRGKEVYEEQEEV